MPEGIEIATYRPEFLEQTLTLQERLWSSDRTASGRYLAWKYELNPDGGDGLILVALHGGEVVAMRGFMGARWRFGGDASAFAVPAAGDTVVSRAFEGRGLFSALTEAARHIYRRRGVRILMNTSASAAVFLRSRRLGWRSPGPYCVLRRRADRRAGEDGAIRGAEILPRLGPIGGQILPDGCVLDVRDDPLPAEMAALTASLPADGRLRRVRDRAYFAWRYQSPLSAYRFLMARRDDALDSFLVLRRHLADKSPNLEIADWAVPSEARLVELVAALADAMPEASLAIWANSLSEPARDRLRLCGFESAAPLRSDRGFVRSLLLVSTDDSASAKEFELAGRSLLAYETWDFRLIDSDGA